MHTLSCVLILMAMPTENNLPIEGDFVSVPIPHVSVQYVETYVGHSSFHEFHENIALVYVKIVRHKIAAHRGSLPVEFVYDFRPKCFWLIKGHFVHILILFERWKP